MTKYLSFLIAASLAFGQQRPSGTYASTISLHVPEETRVAFESWWKDKGRKLAEGILQEDANVTSVVLTRVIFGGTVAPEANFYLTTFSSDVPKNNTAGYEKISQKLWGKSYDAVLKESYPLRKRLAQTLSRSIATAPGTPVEEGDIVRVDRKKVTPGRFGDYMQLEQQYQPLRAAQVAAGNMKAWSAWGVVLPAGSDRDFDAYASHVVKGLADSLNWNRGGSAMAAKLEPPLNYSALTSRASDTSKTTVGETRLVVGVVRRK